MDWLLQFLTSESTLVWIITGTLLVLFALVVIVGLVQGTRDQLLAASTRPETRIDRPVWSAASIRSDWTTLGRELQDG